MRRTAGHAAAGQLARRPARAPGRTRAAARPAAGAVLALFLSGLPVAAEPLAEPCAACHGARGVSAMPNVPSLAGQPADHLILQMILFREGIRSVPAMAGQLSGRSDAALARIAAFYAALPPAPPPDRGVRDPALAARGAALSARMNCGSCHLPDYSGRANAPRLAGQREDFLAHTLREYRDNLRIGADTQMNGLMYGVSDADIAALAHYLAHRD
ncbi:MAG: c-type cytochrome [Acetobacteraceae bacterium]|nr:c-type cytochrome [Acetobacteraceae bacterium]